MHSRGSAKLGNVELVGCNSRVNLLREPISTPFDNYEFRIPGEHTSWTCDLDGQVAERDLESLRNFSDPVDFETDLGQGRRFAGKVWIGSIDVFASCGIMMVSLTLTGSGELTMTLGGETTQFGTPLRVGVGVYQAVHARGTELLLMFLEKKEADEFEKDGRFQWHDEVGRLWTFKRQFHYPVQVVETYGASPKDLCFDFDPEAPVEDLLLLAYLEVKGGRGDKLIEIGTGANEN